MADLRRIWANRMKGVISLLIVVGLAACAKNDAVTQDDSFPRDHRALAEYTFIPVCPYGHMNLKEVDIIYLFGGPAGPTPAFDDRTLERIANHDAFVQPGSDVGDPEHLPHKTVFCPDCGFVYLDRWTRESEDPSSYYRPFSPFLTNFPLPDKDQVTRIRYEQSLEGQYIVSERLYYWTTDSLSSLKMQVLKWAASYEFPLVPPTLPDQRAHSRYPGGKLMTEQVQSWGYRDPDAWINGHVAFVSYPEQGIVTIDLLISYPKQRTRAIDVALKKRPNPLLLNPSTSSGQGEPKKNAPE